MVWLVLLFILVFLLYINTADNLSYWENRHVPSVNPLPLFGNLLNVALGRDHFWSIIERMYNNFDKKYPYFGIYISHKPVLIIRDRDVIKNVLIKHFSSFANRADQVNEKVDPLASNTLFVLKNELWRSIRRKLTPTMTTGKIKSMFPLMTEKATIMGNIIEKLDNRNVDIKDLLKEFSMDVTSTGLFGISCETLRGENGELRTTLDNMFDQRLMLRRFVTFCWVLCPQMVDLFRLPLFDIDSSYCYVNFYLHSEEERKRKNIKRDDLMSLMMNLSEQEKPHDVLKFDETKRTAQALQFLTTGTEAISYTAAVCLYELALNPEIQVNLRSEIRQNLDSDGSISYEALHRMEYLDLVTKESMRKHPFIPFLTRFAENDFIFESTGLKVEKGTQVMIPIMTIHSDPKYFPEPSKFDPERYRGVKMRDLQYAFLPFGEGPRRCIGERLAITLLKLGVATMLKNSEVLPGEKTDIPLKFAKNSMFSTTTDGSVYLKIKRLD